MKSRFLNMAGGSARQVTFGTFHGVFYGILRNTYHINGNNILSEEEKRRLLLELLDRFCPEEERDPDLPSGVARGDQHGKMRTDPGGTFLLFSAAGTGVPADL